MTSLKGSSGTLAPPLIKRKQTNGDCIETVTSTSQLPAAFPWREAPLRDHGFLGKFWHDMQQLKHKEKLDIIIHDALNENLETYTKEEFIPGATQAFATCTDAIFQKKRRIIVEELTGSEVKEESSSTSTDATATKPVPESNNTDKTQESESQTEAPEQIKIEGEELQPSEGVVLDPKDIMGEAIAEFYIQAMASAACAGQNVFYSLDTVVDVKIADIICNKSTKVLLMDSSELVEKLFSGAPDDSFDRRIMEVDIKIDVELACREAFFVRDVKTDLILQGSEAMALVNHRLTLESTVTGSLSTEAVNTMRNLYDDFRANKRPLKDVFAVAFSMGKKEKISWEGPDWVVTNIDDWISDSNLPEEAPPPNVSA